MISPSSYIQKPLRCVDVILFVRLRMSVNKVNKKAVLTTHTADICRQAAFRWRKTLIFDITHKKLVIREIKCFDVDNKMNLFQEPPFLEVKTAASCR